MNFEQRLIVFRRWYPFHGDLDLISSQRRTLIGEGRFELPASRARALIAGKVVDRVEGLFGPELCLTTKGLRSIRESRDAFMDM